MKSQERSKTGEWLTQKFFVWQQEHGEIKTQTEFAEYLGIPQSTLSNWIKGGFEAKGRSLERVAARLNDFEIYDILGLERPDERLPRLVARWSSLSDPMRDLLLQIVARDTVESALRYVLSQEQYKVRGVKEIEDPQVADIMQLAQQLGNDDLDALVSQLESEREKAKA